MRIKVLLAAICLISISLTVALANGETIEFEPASITLDLEELGAYDNLRVRASPPSTGIRISSMRSYLSASRLME